MVKVEGGITRRLKQIGLDGAEGEMAGLVDAGDVEVGVKRGVILVLGDVLRDEVVVEFGPAEGWVEITS